MKKSLWSILLVLLTNTSFGNSLEQSREPNPKISEMLEEIQTSRMHDTVESLVDLGTRTYGSAGNKKAAEQIYEQLKSMGLEVEFQGGDNLRNILAKRSGTDTTSSSVYMLGAHYDSEGPGATDNAAGVAIVLEIARIFASRDFRHSIILGIWNNEENGGIGSTNFAKMAKQAGMNIPLYFNYDSSAYDPSNRLVLDIMYSQSSKNLVQNLISYNAGYGVNFKSIKQNQHNCTSDHSSFQKMGYSTLMTHSETHGPAHTVNDTTDKVNFTYAKKNAQIGLTLMAVLAEVQ
jgi:Zn-dependent M28 family amino/carboxypeptidase